MRYSELAPWCHHPDQSRPLALQLHRNEERNPHVYPGAKFKVCQGVLCGLEFYTAMQRVCFPEIRPGFVTCMTSLRHSIPPGVRVGLFMGDGFQALDTTAGAWYLGLTGIGRGTSLQHKMMHGL